MPDRAYVTWCPIFLVHLLPIAVKVVCTLLTSVDAAWNVQNQSSNPAVLQRKLTGLVGENVPRDCLVSKLAVSDDHSR